MTDELQYKQMTETKIPRLILKLAAPSTLSMLITSVYNMTDTYFVSKLGISATAAVGVVFALMSLIQAAGFTVGMGASSYISRYLGEKDNENANVYASSALIAGIIAGLIIGGAGLIFLDPLMRVLGATESSLPYCRDYARYVLIGAPFMCALFVLNNVLRAEGHASLSMIGLVTGGIVNVALDPLLIFVFNAGIAGAAIATLASQILSLAILSVIFLSKKTIIKISPTKISKNARLYLKVLANGAPTLCRQGLASLAAALLAITAKPYGDEAIAAATVATKIYTMIRSFIVGIGQGYQPMAGYNYGAGKINRVKSGFYFTAAAGTAVCCVFAVFLWFFAEQTISVFQTNEPSQKVIEIGAATLRYFCVALPVLAYSTYVNQTLQCLGKNKSAAFLASCRQGVFFVPMIFLFSHFFGLKGIEFTQACADLLTFAVSVPFQITFFKRLKAN